MKKKLNLNPPEDSRYKMNPYEKSNFAKLNLSRKSPTQRQARAVIRKYKYQLRQREFTRLKQILPEMQTTTDEPSEVSNTDF